MPHAKRVPSRTRSVIHRAGRFFRAVAGWTREGVPTVPRLPLPMNWQHNQKRERRLRPFCGFPVPRFSLLANGSAIERVFYRPAAYPADRANHKPIMVVYCTKCFSASDAWKISLCGGVFREILSGAPSFLQAASPRKPGHERRAAEGPHGLTLRSYPAQGSRVPKHKTADAAGSGPGFRGEARFPGNFRTAKQRVRRRENFCACAATLPRFLRKIGAYSTCWVDADRTLPTR